MERRRFAPGGGVKDASEMVVVAEMLAFVSSH